MSDHELFAAVFLAAAVVAGSPRRIGDAPHARREDRSSEDDYDVLENGEVVGRIGKAANAPEGTPWRWTLLFEYHQDRAQTLGYKATREEAMAALRKSWRSE